MSVTNESRIRSWFQFTSKSSANNTANTTITANNNNNATNGSNAGNGFNGRQTDDESTAAKDQSDGCPSAQPQTTQTNTTSNTLLERVTSFRRSLGKAQNKKNKIRPTSVKGLTSGAVDQQSIAKSKNSCTRKSSSPTSTSVATSGGSTTAGPNCDDDEIYGFTSANFDSSNNSTRRQLKSSLQSSNASSNAPNASIAPNINVYESDTNKSGRVRNEERDESHAITASANNTTTTICKGLTQDSPEWLKADKEFSFYNQQNQQNFESRETIQSRLYYYKQQYFHDSDINLRHSSTQHLSWVAPISSDTDDIDRIYENMRGLSSALASAQQRHQNHRNANNNNNLYANSVNNLSDNNNTVNNNNRKLTKDSGYESASASISNWSGQPINPNNSNAFSNNYFHCRSDSNTSSVSTGGSLSPRTAANKNAYQYCDQWSAAKSISNLPLQVQVSGNRRSSLSGSTHHYSDGMASTGLPVLPAKSVPGNLDRDSDDNIVKKRSHINRNNPTPSSVYSLLASKSGFDFTPVLKSSRKSCGAAFDNQFAKYSERFLPKKLDPNGSHLWKTREKSLIASYGSDNRYETDDSPPPTPPVRDSSLASNRKFNPEIPEMESQNNLTAESLAKGQNDCGHYYKNNNSNYYMKSYSESRVTQIGCSKSLINLRSKYEESSDLKQFSQTYPLLPETEFNDKSALPESWSCDQSVTSGVTSLVTTSDYFTASSSVMTHSPSLSSLSTNATNTTYNNSRNSISSTGSSSQIAKSSKVVQPKRESASVLYSDKSGSPSTTIPLKKEVPPPPPPKLTTGTVNDVDNQNGSVKTSPTCSTLKMVSNSRSIETSKSQRTSDPEIKAIQKRAVYQFYLKQKQKEKQENNNSFANNSNASVTPTTPEDNSQVPSRKVHLVVHENIYENSGAQHCVTTPPLPSPPLPPPPQTTVADIEFVVSDLPLPPPPLGHECEPQSLTNGKHSVSHSIDICEPSFVSKGQQTGRSPSPPKAPSPSTRPRTDVVSQKSEIATQTTDTLRRNSGSASAKEMTQQTEPSLESNETMNQKPNDVPTAQTTNSEQNSDYKSIESVETVVPWAYSKLWPNEKCAKTSHYDTDNSHISAQNSSLFGLANTFIDDTGVQLNNEDLLANKSELISGLSRKLDSLRTEEMSLTQDIDSNEMLGQQLRNRLKSLGLTAQESEKINLHCDETEKVTRLLLSISARLQLIETQIKRKSHQNCSSDDCNESNECKHNSNNNSMVFESTHHRLTPNDLQQIRDKQTAYSSTNFSDEIQSLVSKREKLLLQLEEALQLRVSIDQRNQLIEDKIIRKYFKDSEQNFNEFLEFIKLKSKLIVDIREVRDQIEVGEKNLFTLQTIWS